MALRVFTPRTIAAILFVTVACIAIIWHCIQMRDVSASVSIGPRLVIDTTTHDFGEIDNTKTVEHEFRIRNVGDRPLRIGNVFSSCGCALAEMSSKTLKSGAQAVLRTSLNLRGRNGRLKKFLILHCNDPQQPSVQLWLKANAVEHIQIKPSKVLLGQLTEDVEVFKIINIRSTDKAAFFNITEIRCESPYLEVTAETVTEGREHRIYIRTRPPIPQGKFSCNVQIVTDNPQYKFLVVGVRGTVPRELVVSPTKITVGDTGGGSIGSGEFFIFVGPGRTRTFGITGVETPLASIDAKVLDLGEVGYAIRLKNLPSPAVLAGKTLRIITDATGMEEIVLPFVATGGNVKERVMPGGT